MKKLIMCDLDNTLLPINDQNKFVEIWFSDIAKKLFEYGMNQALCLNALNDACRAMAQNDGSMKNSERFYQVATEKSGYSREELERVLSDYYETTFSNVQMISEKNPYAPRIAQLMNEKAEHAVIATMPMFPLLACDTRMRWTGISADLFELVTSFDQSSYCKPEVGYYEEILARFNATPKETLMIGNDVREDMFPCRHLGIDTFLVTDHIITHDLNYKRFRQGSYEDLIVYLESL